MTLNIQELPETSNQSVNSKISQENTKARKKKSLYGPKCYKDRMKKSRKSQNVKKNVEYTSRLTFDNSFEIPKLTISTKKSRKKEVMSYECLNCLYTGEETLND